MQYEHGHRLLTNKSNNTLILSRHPKIRAFYDWLAAREPKTSTSKIAKRLRILPSFGRKAVPRWFRACQVKTVCQTEALISTNRQEME